MWDNISGNIAGMVVVIALFGYLSYDAYLTNELKIQTLVCNVK